MTGKRTPQPLPLIWCTNAKAGGQSCGKQPADTVPLSPELYVLL